MENRTMDNFDYLLQKKVIELKRTIFSFEIHRKNFNQPSSDIETLRSLDISAISLTEKKSRYLVAVDASGDLPFEQKIEQVIAEIKK